MKSYGWVFTDKKIKLYKANEQIQQGLEYVFPDVMYSLEEVRGSEKDECYLQGSIKNDTVRLIDYVKKANYLSGVNRKIALWGLGDIGKYCLSHWRELYPHIEISLLIDNNPEFAKTKWDGHEIRCLQDVEGNFEDYFIVVCMESYLDAFAILDEK